MDGEWKIRDAMNAPTPDQKVIIPFWGLYLMEMRFASEAATELRELVYFDRFRKMADPARRIAKYIKIVERSGDILLMDLKSHSKLQDYLRNRKAFCLGNWWNMSIDTY